MPERWKIENSCGTDGLHKGYYICSDSWFEKYALSAVISKKYILEMGSKKQVIKCEDEKKKNFHEKHS